VAEARDLFATVDQMIGWSNDRAERTTRKGRSMPVKAQRQERARACPARAAVSLTLFPDHYSASVCRYPCIVAGRNRLCVEACKAATQKNRGLVIMICKRVFAVLLAAGVSLSGSVMAQAVQPASAPASASAPAAAPSAPTQATDKATRKADKASQKAAKQAAKAKQQAAKKASKAAKVAAKAKRKQDKAALAAAQGPRKKSSRKATTPAPPPTSAPASAPAANSSAGG
jgi:hypothetical protein